MGWMSAICDAYKRVGGELLYKLSEDKNSVSLETRPVGDKMQ